MDDSCIFCKIIKKEIPAHAVYEDEHVIAFLDVKPINIGHTLVVPKKHVATLTNVMEQDLINTMNVVQKITKCLEEISDGVNVGQNNGKVAGQEVDHVHFHVIPRHKGDNFNHWPRKTYKEGEAEAMVEQIKKNLA